MHWQDSEQLSQTLEAVFMKILTARMQGVALLNSALSVQAVGFTAINSGWTGILITPWFMNLLLIPNADSNWAQQPPGTKFSQAFPYGIFEFTLAYEPQLGVYGQCSLFSPMGQFTRQEDALAAAESALQGLFSVETPRNFSRRDLLRAAIGKGSR